VQKEIYQIAGTEFNIASPKQLGEILFDKMKLLDKAKKTKTGQYATGEEVLLKLADNYEIARKILDFREYEKLRSTYVDALPKMISKFDHRIHTDYRQAVAATGRLSSNNPNLQNIPIRTEKGRQIRSAFVPRSEEFLFMSADYSQIELRIAASFAKDATMIEAFRNKRDIHATTAAKVFKVDLAKVTPDMRRKAKEVKLWYSVWKHRLWAFAKTWASRVPKQLKLLNRILRSSPPLNVTWMIQSTLREKKNM
jgi:DNA polymerase-1